MRSAEDSLVEDAVMGVPRAVCASDDSEWSSPFWSGRVGLRVSSVRAKNGESRDMSSSRGRRGEFNDA